MAGRGDKVVNLIEPGLCLTCRFAATALVRHVVTGVESRMLHCRRLDCDNWESVDAPPVVIVQVDKLPK
mgnify:CR=1 FL=1